MRAMVVHSIDPTINVDANDPTPARAHCFGPFDSLEEAEMFDRESPDTCYRLVLPITGPWAEDVALAIRYEAEHGHDYDDRLN